MNRAPWILAGWLVGVLLFGPGAVLAAGEPAPATISAPEVDLSRCSGPFSCEAYLEVAGALQATPEVDRVAQLRAWAAVSDHFPGGSYDETQAIIGLCSMLFEAKPGLSFRPPYSGEPIYVGEENMVAQTGQESLVALQPNDLVNGIPFRVVIDYDLVGSPEPASNYLEYCLKETRWTTRRYTPVPATALHEAFDQLVGQPWPSRLDAWNTGFLMAQILPPPPPSLWIGSTDLEGVDPKGEGKVKGVVFNADDPRNAHLLLGLPLGVTAAKITVSVFGGTRPYRWKSIGRNGGSRVAWVLAQGSGQEVATNPYEPERFGLPHPELKAGGELIFSVTDANGAQVSEHLEIIATGELAVHRPAADLAATDPFLQHMLIPAKQQK